MDVEECCIIIYGIGRCGKTTIVRHLIDMFDAPTLAITSSESDYENEVVLDDYNIAEINIFLKMYAGRKTIVLDDFMHTTTENGPQAKHLKSLISTARKPQTQSNIIISTHTITNIGKYIRNLAKVFILLLIDEDSEKILRKRCGLKKGTIEEISATLKANPYSFVIFNFYGEWAIMKLDI